MAYSKKTDRMDIYLDEKTKTILIQLKWKYNWKTAIGDPAWTYVEKKKFHEMADSLIWKKWGSHYKLYTKGSSDFAKKYSTSTFLVNFDIKWVITDPHWNVNVTKIPSGMKSPTSYTLWNSRIINLDTEDTKWTRKKTVGSRNYFHHPITHEFGHAIGNSSKVGRGDEYNPDNQINGGFKLDYSSIMNVGDQLRNRHLEYIITQLNLMIPNTKFYL
ncbi:MAG: hypothetical protein ACK5IC_09115 [Moheibacter sp.]